MRVDQMSVGEMVFDQTTRNHYNFVSGRIFYDFAILYQIYLTLFKCQNLFCNEHFGVIS
jgi:hypothetical protein